MKNYLQNLTPEQLTLMLAIWGAFLSTSLAIFQLIKFIRENLKEKRRLQVSFHAEIAASPVGEPRQYIRVYAVNIGHRPIQVTVAGLELNNGMTWVQTENYGGKNNLPVKLEDGDSLSFFVDYTLALKNIGDLFYKKVFIQDAEGKEYSSKIPKAFRSKK